MFPSRVNLPKCTVLFVTRIYDTSDSVSQYLLGSFSAFQTEKAGVTPFLES